MGLVFSLSLRTNVMSAGARGLFLHPVCGARHVGLRWAKWAFAPKRHAHDHPNSNSTNSLIRETRCEHCLITFANPKELDLHRSSHCFPDAPQRVLELFPKNSKVMDTVNGKVGMVLGPARNCRSLHAFVLVRSELAGGNIFDADVAISRLKVIN